MNGSWRWSEWSCFSLYQVQLKQEEEGVQPDQECLPLRKLHRLMTYSQLIVREESSFSDIPDVKNDFAFLLHMVDQYDQLYSKRFGVFLSEGSLMQCLI
ncbi:hypothetical protein Y1Q_0007547 [Alligator mississippiensis]|uniref:Uncharacterized protein n=1 Tax=Alligator mississippiensis TaxID=8496 RepID=A0A151M543_ALLMI|nr:hypothetical protein Y1Q_0007547 [Alligator mississippiensis]